MVITNSKVDNKAVQQTPHSMVYKLYEPLPDDITEKDYTYVVQEILPQLTETVDLIGYAQEDEEFTVLKTKESFPDESVITKRETEFKNYVSV